MLYPPSSTNATRSDDVSDPRGQGREAASGVTLELADRVSGGGVEARRDEQKVGLEGLERGSDHLLERPSTISSSPAPAWNWTFSVVSFPSPGPPVPG